MQERDSSMARLIDVSHYQTDIDWASVRASGVVGMIAKATQGQNVDPTFVDHIAKAKSAGLLIGGYHFLNALTTDDAAQEARYFASTLAQFGGAGLLDFPPALDFEGTTHNADLTQEEVNALARTFMETFEQAYGVRPMLYTGNAFAQKFDEWAGAYALWVARYDLDAPWDAGPWTSWEFWQYSDAANVGGISEGVDASVWCGTEADMRLKYDKEVRKQMEELKQLVADLQARVDALEQKVQVTSAPSWFVEEFGSGNLGGIIDTPTGDYDFWRTVATAARMVKRLKIQEQ